MGLAVAWVLGGCAVEDDEPAGADDAGRTTSEQSDAEQRAECQEAVRAADPCTGGLALHFEMSDRVAEIDLVDLEDAPRIELPHGYLIEATDESVLYGEEIVHNDHCLAACLLTAQPGQDACVATDAEGTASCMGTGSYDVESCTELTEACFAG